MLRPTIGTKMTKQKQKWQKKIFRIRDVLEQRVYSSICDLCLHDAEFNNKIAKKALDRSKKHVAALAKALQEIKL